MKNAKKRAKTRQLASICGLGYRLERARPSKLVRIIKALLNTGNYEEVTLSRYMIQSAADDVNVFIKDKNGKVQLNLYHCQ